MKTIARLVIKDLVRRRHRPFGMVGAALMPLVLALLVGVVFGGRDGSTMPPIKVVLVDLDQGLLSAMLRSGTGQQETGGERLTLLVAENVEDGLRRLEKEDASALVILPEGLTDDLLDGRKTRLTVYRNPAQSVLPDIVVQGTRIIALGLSILSREFGEPLREIRKMIDSHERPPDWMIAAVAVGVYTRIRAADDYLRSPLITFETLSIDEYKPAHAQHTPTTSENLGESVGG